MYHEHVEVVTYKEIGKDEEHIRRYAHVHQFKVGESRAHFHEWGWCGYSAANVAPDGLRRPISMSTGNVELKSDIKTITTVKRPQ